MPGMRKTVGKKNHIEMVRDIRMIINQVNHKGDMHSDTKIHMSHWTLAADRKTHRKAVRIQQRLRKAVNLNRNKSILLQIHINK